MSNKERIQKVISAAMISTDDKQTMTDIFAQVDDDNLIEVADLFEKKPEWVVICNENRKKKQEAYETNNEALWEEILQEEKKYLEDLTFGLD